jgi:arsenite-transporting ATPase
MLHVIAHPTRYLFFTGKGGTGKTTLATATAVALADRGRRVLLVSTDPASNLGQVLECEVSDVIAAVPAVPGLSTVNIDPEAAASAYRERVVGPVRGALPDDAVQQIVEQLSGACTTEIAAFDEFTKLLTDDAIAATYDPIVFDRSLSDAASTTLVLVARPESSALEEASRTSAELSALHIDSQRLIINGVFEARDPSDALAAALERRGDDALREMPASLAALPQERQALRAHNLVGVASLRSLVADDTHMFDSVPSDRTVSEALPESVSRLLDEVAEAGRGMIMVMGKGGVGKTTIAAAVAVDLASRGLPVHLSTTDPAAHVAETVGGEVEGLTVTRIDPRVETERYIQRVMEVKGKDLDDAGRDLLAEDLRSPCTEEVAVFHAFSRIVNEARRGVVVLDTAPTGHTPLLLDATGAYHREVLRSSSMPAERVVTPMMRLREPDHTRILIVTLPETTPVLEAEALQSDLRRADIEPWAWIVNQSLAASDTTDPLLRARAAAEVPLIERVQDQLARRSAIVSLQADSPVGRDRLRALISSAPAHAEPSHV